MPTIAILIPCYNEELTVCRVINDFNYYLPHANIYVYDNNSTDRTYQYAAENPNCEVGKCYIQGKGATVRKMLQEIDADYYLMVDGDCTYPAEYVNDLLIPVMDNECHMTVGDRLQYSYKRQKLSHTAGNQLVNRFINWKFKSQIKDAMSGYRVFTKEIAKQFAKDSQYDGFEIEVELTMWCLNHRYKIKDIPCKYLKRPKGSKSKLSTVKDGIQILKTIVQTKYIK